MTFIGTRKIPVLDPAAGVVVGWTVAAVHFASIEDATGPAPMGSCACGNATKRRRLAMEGIETPLCWPCLQRLRADGLPDGEVIRWR